MVKGNYLRYPSSTVKPVYSGHHRDQEKVPAMRGVRYIEV